MKLSKLNKATMLKRGPKRLYIGAYGYEERALGWLIDNEDRIGLLQDATMIKYIPSKAKESEGNKIKRADTLLHSIGVSQVGRINYNFLGAKSIENLVIKKFSGKISRYDEIIIDITAMTKFLILICLFSLIDYVGKIRIIYSEAIEYSPSPEEYKESKDDPSLLRIFPSQGFETIYRANCLTSISMQGEPVTFIAFTSFNERLIREMLASLAPHRLILINSVPERTELKWRQKAVQEIHNQFNDDYSKDNPLDKKTGLLKIRSSTLYYEDTIKSVNDIYSTYSIRERIICAATGSKMQTVGLFFAKIVHPDIHVEYPTPDSHYKDSAKGIKKVHEIIIPRFSNFIEDLRASSQLL